MTDASDHDLWWSALYHGGLLIAPSKLVEFFPATCPPLDDLDANRLRTHLARFVADPAQLGALLDAVLEDILGLDPAHWQKGSAVAAEWSVKLASVGAVALWQHLRQCHGMVRFFPQALVSSAAERFHSVEEMRLAWEDVLTTPQDR